MASKSKKNGKKSEINKSAFIREFSPETPAAQIVAKAKEKGFYLNPNMVYAVRSHDKKPKSGRPVGRPPAQQQLSLPDTAVIREIPVATATPKKGLARAGASQVTREAIDFLLKYGEDGAHAQITEAARKIRVVAG